MPDFNRFFFPFMACLTLALICLPNIVLGQDVGCGDLVQFDGSRVAVEASGGDDTANILCAIEAARDDAYPTVRLAPSTFNISSFTVENFRGTLEGTTRESTKVIVSNVSIDCQAMIDAGRTPAAMKFVGGEPRIRSMTIEAQIPCLLERELYLIHFTGDSADAACGNDVIFANVDRVAINTLSGSDTLIGVGVFPEGLILGGCQDTLLGTYKFNRSQVTNIAFGMITSIVGAGQVDVNFNDFDDNLISIFILNANQNTTVTGNNFSGSSNISTGHSAILALTTTASAPNKNRLVVHANTFNIVDIIADDFIAAAVTLDQDLRIANFGVVITDNTFDINGSDAYAIYSIDVSNGLVSNNLYRGIHFAGVYLQGDEQLASDWAIVGNDFSSSFGLLGDIVLDTLTQQCIVGPNQAAFVLDSGQDNVILNDGAASKRSSDASSRPKIGERPSLHVDEMISRLMIDRNQPAPARVDRRAATPD